MDAELGIEPSENLTELHRRILGQDPALEGSRLPPPRALTPREERKLVTVLLADLTDFTAGESSTLRTFAPSSAPTTRIRSDSNASVELVERLTGDSAMALFGVPAAHEDDPGTSCPRSTHHP
jgi:class 3 adenylate cyclase